MKRLFPLLLLLLCAALSACSSMQRTISVWYVVGDPEARETIRAEAIAVPDGETPLDTALHALFTPPEDATLSLSLPTGTALRSTELEDGLLTLDLSAPYGELAGMALTLADACIVLTLTELPEVEAVRITVNGAPLSSRGEQVLSAENFLSVFSADD